MLIYGPCNICGLDIIDDVPHSDVNGEDIHAGCCEESGPCSGVNLSADGPFGADAVSVVLDADMLDDLTAFHLAEEGEIDPPDLHGLCLEIVRNLVELAVRA